MTPLVAAALAGWLLVLIGGAAYVAHAVVRDRRAGQKWRAGRTDIAPRPNAAGTGRRAARAPGGR